MASLFPGGIDSVPDIVNPTVTDCNVAPTLSTRLNLATDAVTAIETWLSNNMGAIFEVPGIIKAYAGASAPSGYLLCNGAAVSRTTFATLFGICGTTYGAGDGSTTFNVPNLSNKFPLGVGTSALGAAVGSNLVGLAVANLPAHNHAITDIGHAHGINDPGHTHGTSDSGHVHGISDPGHIHSYIVPTSTTAGAGTAVFAATGSTFATGTSVTNISINLAGAGTSVQLGFTGISTAANGTGISTQNAGSGSTFSVQNASLVLNYIIKT